MNSEVHNDTAPDSGGGVSAFETMATEYRDWFWDRHFSLPEMGNYNFESIPSIWTSLKQVGPDRAL